MGLADLKFKEPRNIEEAKQRMDQLRRERLDIENQLSSNKGKAIGPGKAQFEEWRKKAGWALLCKAEEYKFVKDWLNEQQHGSNTLITDLAALLAEAAARIDVLSDNRVDDELLDRIDALRNRVEDRWATLRAMRSTDRPA